MQVNIPRIMITAPMSGGGKTTLTCAILKALINQNLRTAAFKAGPDYIDPMFHSKVIGAYSRNLDVFLLGKETTKYLLAKNAGQADVAVLEGVMGYYDGIGKTTEGSAYALAALTQTPAVLCVDAKGSALSVAALINGFKSFRADSNIQGVILNNTQPMVYQYYKEAIEQETGIPLLGYLPSLSSCSLASRHLGLITAAEISDLQQIVERLAQEAAGSIDLQQLLKIAQSAPPLTYQDMTQTKLGDVTLAVAQDKAFCFYYRDALDLLEELGAKLVPFSPLADKKLPACDGVLLGGGYPEVYAARLAANTKMISSLATKLQSGLPCFAECGGFMYLLQRYQENQEAFAWVGAIDGTSRMTAKLTRFGYVTLTAKADNLLCKQGERINAHEFHYSDSSNNGSDFTAQRAGSDRGWDCIHAGQTLFAGYPHMHWYGNIEFAKNFMRACLKYRQDKKSEGAKK